MVRFVITAIARGLCALPVLLISGVCPPATAATTTNLDSQGVITNLLQLRRGAEQKPMVMHPFRIVADVLDADSTNGLLALRDSSGTEFIQLDLQGQTIPAGATVFLEGRGYGVVLKSFGLAIAPGLAVDNDGIHGMTTESGAAFLHAGLNPIRIQWFNGLRGFGLTVEYEGPALPRQAIPSSVLSRAQVESSVGRTNFMSGIDYKCYEGAWGYLPDFTKLHPVRAGVTLNFNLDVRTRDEAVGLEFSGFIKVPRDGVYRFYVTSDDGSRLFVGDSDLEVRVLYNGAATEKGPAAASERSNKWVTLEGTVKFAGCQRIGGELTIRAGNDDIRAEIFESGGSAPTFPVDSKVRISGIYSDVVRQEGSTGPGMLRALSWKAVHPVTSPEKSPVMPLDGKGTKPSVGETALEVAKIPAITTVAKIKSLPAELAKQQLPVSIRGVVTAFVNPAFIKGAVVQDSTKGIFISLEALNEPKPLQRGEFCQIEGVTGPGLFAPVIIAHRVIHLGPGELPQPLHPTWDQLLNGSLDTQYTEIEGVVTATHDQQLVILTEGGKVTLQFSDFDSEALTDYQDDLVRIRGCIFANFDLETHNLEARSLRIMNSTVDVLQKAPADLFDTSQRSIGELLLYDPKAAPLRRLKVHGQVIYGRAGEYFLTDGTNGLCVIPRTSDLFAIGDMIDAVGFLELGGPTAELKDAAMRKTGSAPMPAATALTAGRLLQARYAGTLVKVDATLMNHWLDRSEYVLELQAGFLAFRARVDNRSGSVLLPPPGSRLELTGVYSPQGTGNGTVNSFELLLHSPSGVRVLATPSWWTLKRVLILAGILAALLFGALVWNRELQWKVQQRSRQLEIEVRNRHQAELKHAAEAERSRIARDLHDELGTGLTEMSLLAGTGVGEVGGLEKNQERFRVIAEKARALVSGLDVIVWAIDPKRNSLQSFADYLARYATELFSVSNIICRFKIPIECAAVTLTEAARHSLFLAVKEALNNVIRHASATEVELRMSQSGSTLEIVISDDGRGFDSNTIHSGNGLANLHYRLEVLDGQCDVASKPGKGTTIRLSVPLRGGLELVRHNKQES